jgi:Copper amine oxidase, enzyme domain
VDLVGWVMAGVQHIPRSEDVPVVRPAAAFTRHNDAQLPCCTTKEAAALALLLLQELPLQLHMHHANVT